MTVASDTQNPVDRAADETEDDVTSERQQAGHERSAPPPHASFMDAGSDAIGLGRSGRYPLLPRSSMARPTASGVALWTPANARTRGSAWCRGKPPPSTRDSIPSMCSRIVLYRTSTVVHIAGPVKPEFDAPVGAAGCLSRPCRAVLSAHAEPFALACGPLTGHLDGPPIWWAGLPVNIAGRRLGASARHAARDAEPLGLTLADFASVTEVTDRVSSSRSSGTGFPPGFGTSTTSSPAGFAPADAGSHAITRASRA